ncbi:MAG: hypothetical protein WCL08_00325 [Verrucomicrobiota bacterium]
MSIITTLRDDLLGLAGFEDPSGAPQSLLSRILSDINSVGQRLQTRTPDSWWSMDDGSALLHEPTLISALVLTNGATTLTGTGLASWMHGCSVQLSGEAHYNEIRLSGSTYGLRIPYSGGTVANGTGTVYNDAINLTRASIKVLLPVSIPQRWQLEPAANISDLRNNAIVAPHYRDAQSVQYPFFWQFMRTGVPTTYLVEPSPQATGEVLERIRIYPLPDTTYPLVWKQQLTFTPVTSFADTRPLICPHAYHDSVFLPLMRKSFLGSQYYKGSSFAANLILAEAKQAEDILETLGTKFDKDVFMNPSSGL